ncbi:MAG: DUF3052 family protein [Deltaproteobacteria bacterium]|nr:DUF3052 family protein [Deltaproteobacteria bacterium]
MGVKVKAGAGKGSPRVGYSGAPLPKKLGIKEGHRVVLIDAPDGFEDVLGELPSGVGVRRGLDGSAPVDVFVVFVSRRAALERVLEEVRRRMAENGGFWVAWPKRAAKVATDMTEDVVREVALPTGLVDNKVCAIDAKWSGLRLVIRSELRSRRP